MPNRYYLGLSASWHDPSLAIVNSAGEVVFAEASERYMQDKRAFNCPPDHLLRTRSLVKEYCEPDAELVAAITFSEQALRVLQLGVLGDMNRVVRAGGTKLGELLDSQYDHLYWPHPSAKAMRALTRNSLSQAALSLQSDRSLRNPVEVRRFDHHLTHAMYACRSSDFDAAVCAIVDGYGEWSSTSFFRYRDGAVERLRPRPSLHNVEMHSLGLFYGMVCGMCGFDPMKGEEWKVMGLAPYGKVDPVLYKRLRGLIRIDGLRLVRAMPLAEERRVVESLWTLRRAPEIPPIESADIARTGHEVFCDMMRELLQNLYEIGGSRNLVLGGGCALNSSWNGRIVEETSFDRVHVPSAPGDDGNSIGAAWIAHAEDHPETQPARRVLSPFLGTGISAETRENLARFNGAARALPGTIVQETARLLAQGKIVGWMQGRAEFGPRALGNRSILADPRSPEMKDRINARVKFREEFRPFAPSILHEFGPQYFDNYQFSPYMERTLRFRPEVRDKVPAVVHDDGTGRLQSVTPVLCDKYCQLIKAFYDLTKIPMLLNTSFNIMGKPIIHSVEDAVGVFYTTGLDALVIDDLLIEKPAAGRASP